MRSTIIGFSAIALAMVAGCSFAARSPEMYRDDTQKVLDTRAAEIKACYDGILKADAKAEGTVSVRFDVMEESGQITNVKLDEAASSAPQPVRDCVTTALQGLVLKPGDARLGKATFVWEFMAGQAGAAVPAESAPAAPPADGSAAGASIKIGG
jgi:hypothetical protein